MDIPNLHEWQRDLRKCPSQIYYHFQDPDTNKKYCIYLRWRHNDPWTAELIELTDRRDFTDWSFSWQRLNVKDYAHDEYPLLEVEVLEIVKKKFPHINFHKK